MFGSEGRKGDSIVGLFDSCDKLERGHVSLREDGGFGIAGMEFS